MIVLTDSARLSMRGPGIGIAEAREASTEAAKRAFMMAISNLIFKESGVQLILSWLPESFEGMGTVAVTSLFEFVGEWDVKSWVPIKGMGSLERKRTGTRFQKNDYIWADKRVSKKKEWERKIQRLVERMVRKRGRHDKDQGKQMSWTAVVCSSFRHSRGLLRPSIRKADPLHGQTKPKVPPGAVLCREWLEGV